MILPALELVGQSVRTLVNARDSDLGYFHLRSLLTLVWPDSYGLLSGKYQASAPSNFRRFRSDFSAAGRVRREPLVAALRDIAVHHRATAAQVALAWLVNKPNVVAIPGASSVKQLEENAAAADLGLGDDEVQRLDSLSA